MVGGDFQWHEIHTKFYKNRQITWKFEEGMQGQYSDDTSVVLFQWRKVKIKTHNFSYRTDYI